MNIIDLFAFAVLNKCAFSSIRKELKLLEATARFNREGLDQIRLKKLELLLSKSRLHVPYWKNLISKDLAEGKELSTKEVFERLPLLTKKIIRENGENMWSNNIKKYRVATTGGTTGHPLSIRRDYGCYLITEAALWRARRAWGITPSQRTMYLNAFGKGTFLGRLKLRLANKKMGEAFPSSDNEADLIAKEISRFRPKALEGYATGLLETVLRTKSKKNIRIPVIVSTGEMVYPHQRKALQDHYSGKLYTYYGSNEIGSIAFECDKQQLHVCEEHVIVEVIDEKGLSVFNKPGKVVVTDLDNMAMPFIRYELGDIAIISDAPCECGNNSRVISELIGRTQDYLSGVKGEKLQATQLSAYLKDLKAIGQLQFIQESSEKIIIHFDRTESEAKDEIIFIKTHLRDRLGEGVTICFQNVEEILKTNRGKQPLVIRKVEG